MARWSVLVLAVLLVAPCASMKMKAAGPDDLPMPHCVKVRYNQLSTYNTKSCYVYHSFMGYHPETGAQQRSPEIYGFADMEFLLDGISDEQVWRWNKQYNSWMSGFPAETADGSLVSELNCNKRTANWGTIPGYIDTCPHGPLWQAEKQYNDTAAKVKTIQESIKKVKREIDRTRKVMKIMAKGSIPDLKGNLTETKAAFERIKGLVKAAKEAKNAEE